MLAIDKNKTIKKAVIILALCLSIGGILFRLNNIMKSDFIFYDEGYYLNHNRKFAQIVTDHGIKNFRDFCRAFNIFTRFSLATGKALWFGTVDFRIFLGGMKAWYFPRVVAALAGIATLGLIYFFARRFYESPSAAWLSVAILAVYPSHVFYSRVGLQETFCTLLMLGGFYLYIFPRQFGWRTFAAGILLSLAFFANYRMIILPGFVAACEIWLSFSVGQRPSFRKYLWFLLTFLSCVFFIGNIEDAQNTVTTFAWMFYQASLAETRFHIINFLSYPYYVFRLDNAVFGLLFFGNIYLLFKGKWRELFPVIFVLMQMFAFSFAFEKGARYLCVVFPFMIMAVAYLIALIWEDLSSGRLRQLFFVGLLIMLGFMAQKSYVLSQSTSDYRSSTEYLLAQDPDVKFLSTQPYVQNLYLENKHHVKGCPHRIEYLFEYYLKGFRYLVLCPQAYISWTEDKRRFTPELEGYLPLVTTRFKPMKVYSNFNDTVLERFVFDHNENLFKSIEFLELNKERRFGELKIYDIQPIIVVVTNLLAQQGYDLRHHKLPTSELFKDDNL